MSESRRIAVAELKQESNSFAPAPTSLQSFRDFHLWYGSDVVSHLRNTNTEVGGFLDVCETYRWSVQPILAAFAVSGGPLTADCFAYLLDELLTRLTSVGPLDGVLLALHGAMLAEGEDDPDGYVLTRVRELVGPRVPVVASLDLHANLTARMVSAADALVGFRTCPHIDQHDTGRRAAMLMARLLAGERLTMRFIKLPMISPASLHLDNQEGPFQRLMNASRMLEQGSVLSTSIFTVQPWLDIPHLGHATLAIATEEMEAVKAAQTLAQLVWNERHALIAVDLVPPDEAIRRALSAPVGPILLSELADGTGAGSPGDATAALSALLAAAPDRPCLAWIYDPEVAAEAQTIGVGGQIDVLVGGKRDRLYNRPIRFRGVVDLVCPASFHFSGQGYTGIGMDMGLSAILRCGQVALLVTSKPVMTVDPALYRAVGLEPSQAQIVLVKSHIQFRAGYAGLARGVILLDTPGVSSDHLEMIGFRRINRPLFPLDRNMEWTIDEV